MAGAKSSAGTTPAAPTHPVSTIVWTGPQRSVALAKLENGEEPARRFYESLPESSQAKFDALFERICDHGMIKNDQMFHTRVGDIHCSQDGRLVRFTVSEFKVHHGPGYRILAILEGSSYVLSHGFDKPKKSQLPGEIARAERHYCEDRRRRLKISSAKGHRNVT